MSVLVAGGSGFVGLNVVETYLEAGEAVVIYDRAAPPESARAYLESLPGKLIVVTGSVNDRAAVIDALRSHGVDRVVYAAAITSGPDRERSYPELILETNLVGLACVAKAASEAGVRRMVNCSSAAAYGDAGFGHWAWDGPMQEEATREQPVTLYSITKYATERVGARIADLTGLDLRSVRLTAVFGAWERDTGLRDTLSTPMQASAKAVLGEPVVLDRREARDWTYSRWVANGIRAVVEAPNPNHALYNIACGETWSTADWCERLAKTFPDFEWRFAEPGEAPTISLHGDRDRFILDNARLRDDIGYTPSADIDLAYGHFETWLKAVPDYWTASRG